MRIAVRKIGLWSLLGVALAVASPGRAYADAVCDLRVTGNQNASCAIYGGLFYTNEQHPTGTGFIDSFLRIQQNGWEQGYNTSARPTQDSVQVKVDPNYTRNLTLAEVGTKVIGSTTYREFFLDINEPAATNGNKNYITLDQLEIYVSNTPSLNYYCASSGGSLGLNGTCTEGAYAKKIYDLDTAMSVNTCVNTVNGLCSNDAYVQLDYLVKGNGSGSSDMAFYLDSSLFNGYQYVYLFSQFGDVLPADPYKYESQAGFEEWFTKSSIPPPNTAVPEPASLLLLGSGLGAAAWSRRRKKNG